MSEFGCCLKRFVHQPQKIHFDNSRLCSQPQNSGSVQSRLKTQIVLEELNEVGI